MYIVNTSFIKNAKQSKIIHLILSILRTKELVNNCSKVDCFSEVNIKALQLANIELTTHSYLDPIFVTVLWFGISVKHITYRKTRNLKQTYL